MEEGSREASGDSEERARASRVPSGPACRLCFLFSRPFHWGFTHLITTRRGDRPASLSVQYGDVAHRDLPPPCAASLPPTPVASPCTGAS